ncbi:MAG: hypothetical protein LJE62_10875 [Silicimonas sp.]|nr:hypothetical protein [Silicimonas sp.]
MAMLESLESFTIEPNRTLALVRLVGGRFQAWLRSARKYRAARRELLQYSQHELTELGMREADIEGVATSLTLDEPTRCRLVETKQKRILAGGRT